MIVNSSIGDYNMKGLKRSQNDPSGPAPTSVIEVKAEAPEKETIKRKVNYLDDNFEFQSKEITFDFVPAVKIDEAMARLNGDEKTIVAALNTAIQRKAGSDARVAQFPTGTISKKAFLDFVKPYRNATPFKEMVTLNKGEKGWKEQYAAQTKALAEQVKTVSFMVAAIKSASANVLDDEDGTEDE